MRLEPSSSVQKWMLGLKPLKIESMIIRTTTPGNDQIHSTKRVSKFIRSFVLSCLVVVGYGNGLSAATVFITSNTTWSQESDIPDGTGGSTDDAFQHGIVIQNDATLTITGITLTGTNHFQASILVEQGHLVIENCDLTFGQSGKIELTLDLPSPNAVFRRERSLTITDSDLYAYDDIWIGIKALDAFDGLGASQYDTDATADEDGCDPIDWSGTFNDEFSHTVISGSEIREATIGLEVGPGLQQNQTHTGGGVIEINDSKFINCETSILVELFNGALTNSQKYAGHIMRTDFLWDNNFPSAFGEDPVHINIDEVNGWLNIGGCTFKNTSTTQHCPAERGTGILIHEGSMGLSQDGDRCCDDQDACFDNCYGSGPGALTPRDNEFEQLGFGIDITEGNLLTRIPSSRSGSQIINKSNFTDCAFSIRVENTTGIGIKECEFTLTENSIDDVLDLSSSCSEFTSNSFVRVVSLTDCDDVRIVDNDFTADLDVLKFIDMVDPKNARASVIKGNDFDNDFVVPDDAQRCAHNVTGINLVGNHNFLDITCNEFTDVLTDLNTNQATINDIPDNGVVGHANKSAANVFSTIPGFLQSCTNYFNIDHNPNSVLKLYDFSATLNNLILDHVTGQVITGTSCSSNPSSCVSCVIQCDIQTRDVTSTRFTNTGLPINLYPNPSNGEFNVQIRGEKVKSCYVVDILGNRIPVHWEPSGRISNFKFSLENPQTGFYLLLLESNAGTHYAKFLVE